MRAKFDVGFPLLEKVQVNGPQAHPVWQWLRMASGTDGEGAIGWNFTMFLVGPEGQNATRFPNAAAPLSIRDTIVARLEEAAASPASAAPAADGN